MPLKHVLLSRLLREKLRFRHPRGLEAPRPQRSSRPPPPSTAGAQDRGRACSPALHSKCTCRPGLRSHSGTGFHRGTKLPGNPAPCASRPVTGLCRGPHLGTDEGPQVPEMAAGRVPAQTTLSALLLGTKVSCARVCVRARGGGAAHRARGRSVTCKGASGSHQEPFLTGTPPPPPARRSC